MGYYNYKIIVFAFDEFQGELEWRFATQKLPGGAIPIAIVDATGDQTEIFQITDARPESEIWEAIPAEIRGEFPPLARAKIHPACPKCQQGMDWQGGLLQDNGYRDMSIGRYYCNNCNLLMPPQKSR